MPSPWSSLLSDFPLAATSHFAALNSLYDEALVDTAAVPLANTAILSIQGPDASKFLQGQATTDFREVTDTQSRLGCFVSLKGRAITSYRAIQQGERIDLLLDSGLAEELKTRLAKYIVFSKATISLDETRAAFGLYGAKATDTLNALGLAAPQETNEVIHHNEFTVVRLQGDNRFLVVSDINNINAQWKKITDAIKLVGENAWTLAAIRSGEAHITRASTEVFQPQELNYHVLDGVSYNKGCYTGQEIVARLYFRGKLKQQTARFSGLGHELPLPNAPLFANGKHVADVVQSAFSGNNQFELLAVARPEHFNDLSLSENGEPLKYCPLPYDVPIPE